MEDIPGSNWVKPLEICIVQPKLALGDIDDNVDRALRLIDRASEEGPIDIIVLPEVFATGFPYEELPELAKRYGSVVDPLAAKARELKAYIMFTVVVKDENSYFNRFIALDPSGNVHAQYNKTHLFSRAGEDKFFTPGNETVSFEVKGAKVAPLICYEVRFLEMSRKMVLEGAEILIYPAQWPAFRIFQWELLLKARAVENQCYVIGVDGFGPHGDTEMGGNSMVIAPYGDVLCRVDDQEGYARTTIGPERIRNLRSRIPVLMERRPDIY
jgi:predicted amidohydrolase